MKNSFYEKYTKRALDIICSAAAITVFSPLYLGLIIAGAIAMKGNPFFTQPRPGKDEKIFNLIKFRTMSQEKDENGALLPDEVRLNKYGRFLRSTSLDEIPEAFNVFAGQMSIVGPRPLLVRDVAYMTTEQKQRHSVRPGISGLAQVRGRNLLNWDEKLATDLEYVEKISFGLDCKIVFMTIAKVLKHDGIEYEVGTDIDLKDWIELKKKNAESINS